MIQKHAIPILEFDDNPQAVIMPNHEGLDLQLPKKCVYAFLGEEIDRYAREVGANCVGEFVSATKTYPVYVINYKGEEVCLAQAPVGSAPAAQFMDWLIGYGVGSRLSLLGPVVS
ncbi:phosphorylase Pnp/Udp family protein [Streptococcus pneumoniae]|nr:phosphorylase Pnp/Udp family protein [Streptococcus pneumoniae]